MYRLSQSHVRDDEGVRLGGGRAVGPAQRPADRARLPPRLRRGPVVAGAERAHAVFGVLRGPRGHDRRPPSRCHVEHHCLPVPGLGRPEVVVQKKKKKDKQFTSSIVEWYLGVCASSVVCSSSFVLPARLELAIP